MAEDGYLCPFGGTVKSIFNDVAIVEIWDCAVMPRGEMVAVPKGNFAAQSFHTGVGGGDYVEGNVYKTGDVRKPYELKHVTKII